MKKKLLVPIALLMLSLNLSSCYVQLENGHRRHHMWWHHHHHMEERR